MQKGLTQKEAEAKLREFGPNEIKEVLKISPLNILLRQVKNNFIVYFLFAAMLISFFVEKSLTGYAIGAVILIVILVGFVQEYRAERAIKALKEILTPVSIVLRDGKEKKIPTKNIVPGDVIILKNGDRIPADCIVLEETELRVNESILTGESAEVKKCACVGKDTESRENLLFMGTFIVNGKCIAKVLHTGMNTEFGKIAGMISATEKELPLKDKVNKLAKFMVFVGISVSLLTGAIMITQKFPPSFEYFIDVLIVVIALSVSAFPEGMPVALITTLSAGAYRMAKRNAIVNRMSIIETLGETTIICADKTGTITKGEMTVKKILADNAVIDVSGGGYSFVGDFILKGKKIEPLKNKVLNLIIKASLLCNDAKIEEKINENRYKMLGTPTESALVVMAAKAGVFVEDLKAERVEEIPFSSEKKMMSVLCRENSKYFVYAKGAPEVLLKHCTHFYKNGKIIRLNKDAADRILTANKRLTKESYRTIAIAYKPVKNAKKRIDANLVFLGIVGIEDPPRDTVKESIKLCQSAGITVKMITGDNKETAIAIAKQIGLKGDVLEGKDIDEMTDNELYDVVKNISIFARVRPEHKMRIIKALKQHNEIVTMTGDGVNDAPALKEAHIGVAMGTAGTDVSRESSDLILKDDNFSTIVDAVAEGRTIFNNMRKFVAYQLSCNFAELTIIFMGILLGLPLPLLALQILFMNLVTDDLPAITLGLNPRAHDVMKVKPRKESGLLNKASIVFLVVAGLIISAVTLGVFYYSLSFLDHDVGTARTTALVTLILFEITNAFNFRSFRKPVFLSNPFQNKYLVFASIISLLLTLMIVYTPLNIVFETVPIDLMHWVMTGFASLSVIVVFDLIKIINIRFNILKVQ